MAFIPVLNTARIVVRATMFGRDVVNVLHATGPGAISAAGLEVIGDITELIYRTEMQPLLSQDLVYQDVTVRNLTTDSGPQVVVDWTASGAGGSANPSMSSNVAFVVTHRTANIGRSFRGRTYVAGLPEVLVTANQLDVAVAGGLAFGFNELRDALASSGFVLSVVSLVSGGAPRAAGVSTPITLSVSRDTRVDTQRRRLG